MLIKLLYAINSIKCHKDFPLKASMR